VYPVLFALHGLSIADISTLYVLWSATSLLLQVPAGALADRMSRRTLLVVAGLVRAVGYALWTLTPTFAGFAAGFVLWGIAGALNSGTFEALVYDELALAGTADAYGRLTGRAGTVKLVVSAAVTALAIPLLRIGGFGLVGAVSVASCVAWALVALTLPERPRQRQGCPAAGGTGLGEYLATLRAGVTEAARRPTVRRLLVLAALLPALTAIDEYVPLLGRAYHLPSSLVPLFLLGLTFAAAIGTWCAGRWWSARPGRVAAALAVGAVALLASGAGDRVIGYAGVAVGFGLVQYGIVATDVRLQYAIAGPARATVTSVAEVGADLAAILVFGVCAVLSRELSVIAMLATFGVPLAALAVVARRWLAVDPGVGE
jgi:MFS family permease